MEDKDNIATLTSVKPLKSEYSHLQKIALTSEQFSLGRSIGKSAVIPYLSISRLHCIFNKTENNDWYIQDCSSFGISINNKKLGKGSQVIVSDGDIITLEPTAEFVYKFSHPNSDALEIPKKRIKLEKDTDSSIMNDVKLKFEESQNYEIKLCEEKLQNAKQKQTKSINLKQQLQADRDRKIQELESGYAAQIENLKGEKNEVERQKALLIEERNEQLAQVKNEMEGKIAELMEEIKKHNENESELLKENNLLKDKLDREREEFLAELSRESSSKKDMLEKLEAKIREQEEARLKEKQEMVETLKKETEQLRLAQEKELKEISEQKRLRELELEQELANIKQKLQEKAEQTEQLKHDTTQQLNMKMEELQKLGNEDKIKVEQLQKEREEIQNQLLEAQRNAEVSLAELRQRESELATLSAARVQALQDQTNEVTTLQEQLDSMKTALEFLEAEKNALLSMCLDTGEGTSGTSALAKVGALMDSELQCSICSEMFIEAIVLNCSHTYCKYCINMWKKRQPDCPICRAPITSENRSLVVDNFIERMVNENFTEEMKQKRQEILKFRAEQVSLTTSRRTAATTSSSRRRRNTRNYPRVTIPTARRGGRGLPPHPIQSVDLTMVPLPMSPAERPPVLSAPVSLVRVYQPQTARRARAAPATRQAASRPVQSPPSPSTVYYFPEIVDLTMVPTQGNLPERSRPPAASASSEMVDLTMVPTQGMRPPAASVSYEGPIVVAGTVDVETSPASPGRTTAATGAATGAARADTGPPAAPSGSASSSPRHGRN